MGKGAPSAASIPEVQEPTPVAPANPPVTESSAEVAQAAAEENPMGRNATPEDVAPAMAFLLSEEARFITGVTLPVTGGSAIV